jgi:hypothetical protein
MSSLVGSSPYHIFKNNRITTLKPGSIRGFSSLLSAQAGGSYPYGSYGYASLALSLVTLADGGRLPTAAFVTPALGFACTPLDTTACKGEESDDWGTRLADRAAVGFELTDEINHLREAELNALCVWPIKETGAAAVPATGEQQSMTGLTCQTGAGENDGDVELGGTPMDEDS